jgi:hypothetical protein
LANQLCTNDAIGGVRFVLCFLNFGAVVSGLVVSSDSKFTSRCQVITIANLWRWRGGRGDLSSWIVLNARSMEITQRDTIADDCSNLIFHNARSSS